MILSGIGIAGFQALSHWNPGQENPGNTGSKIITDTGTGSSETLSVTSSEFNDYGTGTGSVPYDTYDVGQTIPFTLKQSTDTGTGTAYLYIAGSEVTSTTSSTTSTTVYNYQPSSTGSISWYLYEYVGRGTSSGTDSITID